MVNFDPSRMPEIWKSQARIIRNQRKRIKHLEELLIERDYTTQSREITCDQKEAILEMIRNSPELTNLIDGRIQSAFEYLISRLQGRPDGH